ncbi:MAG TPA: hypothetical protein VFL16_15560 [Steroidobacteraceae bacterium]|nr:hypothetical protein [Steroidobacteraceae bacterium]
MNLQSEISFFSEMALADKARLMASFLYELTAEARASYGPTQDAVYDGAHLRFTNETCNRVAKLIEQYLGDDNSRPADDVVLRMLLSPRADKVAEKMLQTAYRRALQNFERYDTTVFMSS